MTPPEGSRGVLAALPDAVPSLSGVHPVLARSGPGAPGILVEGRRACARSGAAAPTIAIEIDGIPLAEVATDGGRVANTLAAPGHARREIVGKSGVGTESLVAAPTLPLVCLQWEGARVPVRLLLDADAGRPSERSERGLVFALPDGRVAAVAVAPDGARLVASEEPGSGIAEAPDAAEHLSVRVAAGSPPPLTMRRDWPSVPSSPSLRRSPICSGERPGARSTRRASIRRSPPRCS